jgi:hypothetical protein
MYNLHAQNVSRLRYKKRGPQIRVLFFALLPLHALVHSMTFVAELALIGGELRYVVVVVGL